MHDLNIFVSSSNSLHIHFEVQSENENISFHMHGSLQKSSWCIVFKRSSNLRKLFPHIFHVV